MKKYPPIFVFTICLILISGCSNTKSKTITKKKLSVKESYSEVKVEKSLFNLVGCNLIDNIEAKSEDPKLVLTEAKKKAHAIGGNTLNNLEYAKKQIYSGDTIFSAEKAEHLLKGDVYRCKRKKKIFGKK